MQVDEQSEGEALARWEAMYGKQSSQDDAEALSYWEALYGRKL